MTSPDNFFQIVLLARNIKCPTKSLGIFIVKASDDAPEANRDYGTRPLVVKISYTRSTISNKEGTQYTIIYELHLVH